jgi:hypothetical protein
MSVTATFEKETLTAVRARGSRLGAAAGLAFALCFFIGTAMLDTPEEATNADIVAWWSDRGHRIAAIVSMYLFVIAGLCFLVFLVKLRSRLLAAERGAGELSAVVHAAGLGFVAMLFVAGASRGVIGFAVASPAHHATLPGADTLRYLPQFGHAALGTAGMLAAAVAMASTSWLILKTAVFGRWLAWVGAVATAVVVVACAALSGVFAIPALLIWAAAVSVALWRRA